MSPLQLPAAQIRASQIKSDNGSVIIDFYFFCFLFRLLIKRNSTAINLLEILFTVRFVNLFRDSNSFDEFKKLPHLITQNAQLFDFDFNAVASFQINGRFLREADTGRRSGGDNVARLKRYGLRQIFEDFGNREN